MFENGTDKFNHFMYWGAIDHHKHSVLDHSTFTSPGQNNHNEKGWHEQHTGLFDKEGNPIWEGDIFQVAGNRKYEVRYSQGSEANHEWYGGMFVLFLSDENHFPFDEYAMKNGKVIGNIHENPELLK
jgi:uncharacterized phage protein (TIGR01671 family)